jgi:hypothetical protein
MTDRKPVQYKLDCVQSAFKALAHAHGHMKRMWAGCQCFHFEPEGKNYFLLTSPFIEQVGTNIIRSFCTPWPYRQICA